MKLLSSLSVILLSSAPLSSAWFVTFYNNKQCTGWAPGSMGDHNRGTSCQKLEDNWWSADFKAEGEDVGIIFYKDKNCAGEYLFPGGGVSSCTKLDGMWSWAVLKRK
ncbi:hypothetical protein BDV38DRAFT_281160 [Aspergillus pseudotamarii]|uniref:Uncharacterized protein n=1 Tax=Aspergillus pseudotamarii TaxID=132259 RepID=A0A5N6SXP5_ASPPS|nr:uncharacterized protein BDV38DRAFT_281160 [Aspergillus pseudotamarii]KAE8139392.1 hypothetical protein BDV38DRAFT_281160 [Aspergillus pseudotamarii]